MREQKKECNYFGRHISYLNNFFAYNCLQSFQFIHGTIPHTFKASNKGTVLKVCSIMEERTLLIECENWIHNLH